MNPDVVKDLLGLIGSILLIAPFLHDFAQRRVARRWQEWRNLFPAFRRTIEPIAAMQELKLKEPSRTDMRFVMAGILLLIASFAVSLYGHTQGTP